MTSNKSPSDDRHHGKPKTPDEFIRCIIWTRLDGGVPWHRGITFMEGSKQILALKAGLIRESIAALQQRKDLTDDTHALTQLVDPSDEDDVLQTEWKKNLSHLRALHYTSPVGTERQRLKLLEISQNARLVAALRYALEQDPAPNPKGISPPWIAVLYAEGSAESVRAADRLMALLKAGPNDELFSYLSAGRAPTNEKTASRRFSLE